MELNFTELDNNNTKNPYETFNYNAYTSESNINPEKYWEQNTQKKQEKPVEIKKKKVSFDDILSNMNLVVNKSGVLQFMQPQQEQIQETYNQEMNNQQMLNQQYYQPQYQPQYHQPINVQKTEPVDPSVKHSYIYNKYFKDYQDAAPKQPQIRVPKTMEEYHQMLLEDKIKELEQKRRISEIKSTKLMFTSNQGYGPQTNPRNMQASRNNLRMMNFR